MPRSTATRRPEPGELLMEVCADLIVAPDATISVPPPLVHTGAPDPGPAA